MVAINGADTSTTTSSQPSTSPTTTPLLTTLADNGFVIIPSVLTPTQLTTLRAAAATITTLARSGSWPHIRTLPKQFPPWPSDASAGIWGVQHLLHPSAPSPGAFATSYFSDAIAGPAKEILGCGDEELVMELYNLLVRPDRDFALRWHRDDVSADAGAAEEMARLARPAWHAPWNLALYPDRSLVVVPGSHARARTEEERGVDAFADDMPGQMVVELGAGDVVFYNNNILHRGVYDMGTERMTLHGSVGHVAGSALRARNVLQHGVGEWVDRVDFMAVPGLEDGLRERAEGMRRRLVEMGKKGGYVGFSHED